MKISSKGRSEIIEQANRRVRHMGHDFDIDKHDITIECDLSLPVKTDRKYSMMTALNEELFNASRQFLENTTILYDGDKNPLNEDALYTVVTRVFHNAIEMLNAKGEPLFNVFVKKKKDEKKQEVAVEEKKVEAPKAKQTTPTVGKVESFDTPIDVDSPQSIPKPARNFSDLNLM
jgi:hypothetical protein